MTFIGAQKFNIRQLLRLSVVWMCLVISSFSMAKDSKLNMSTEVDLRDLVEMAARWKKKNVITDNSLKGKVRLHSTESMSEQEIWEMVLATLNVSGFTILETTKLLKVVPIKKIREQSTLTLTDGDWVPNSETIVTKLESLNRASAKAVFDALKPLVTSGDLLLFEQHNALMVIGTGVKTRQLQEIIQMLDGPGMDQSVQLIYLKYAFPSNVVKKIQSMIPKTQRQNWQVFAFDGVGAVIVAGSRGGIESVRQIVKKLDAPSASASRRNSSFRIFPLQYADAKLVSKDVSTLYRERPQHDHPEPGQDRITMKVTAWEPNNAILMMGSRKDQEGIASLIRKLDRKKVQIYLDVDIVEISGFSGFEFQTAALDGVESASVRMITGWNARNPLQVSGAVSSENDSGARANALSSFSQNLVYGMFGVGGLNVPGLGRVGASRFIETLKRDTRSRTLSNVQLLAIEGEASKMNVGETVFLRSEQPVGSAAAGAKYQKEEVGLEVELTPHVSNSKNLTLQMSLIQTSFDAPQGGASAAISKRKTKQVFQVEDQQSLVIAGIEGVRELEEVSKVPLLGDIPLLGYLFRGMQTRKEKTQVMIFVTPRIVYDADRLSDLYVEERAKRNLPIEVSSGRPQHTDPRKGM